MTKMFSFARVGVVFAFLAVAAGPANAQAEQYEKPVLMHAILAKVWGNVCPGALSKSEISEVQTFIDRWISTRPDPESFKNDAAQVLERIYTETYQTPGKCLEWQAKQKTRDYLSRIRKATSDPDYWSGLRQGAARS